MTRILCLLVVLCALPACGAAPVAFSDIPVPPDAREQTVLEGAYEVPIDLAIAGIREALGRQYGEVSYRVYAVPKGTPWADVQRFYEEQLDERVWTARSVPVDETPATPRAVWTRGGWRSEQALAVALARYFEGEQDYLVVVLTRVPEAEN